MPPPKGQISQKDFVDKIRQEAPELKDFSDDQIVNKIIELRPEWKNRIYTPDMAAADEQSRLQTRSHSIVDPETWKNHPMLGHIAKSVLSASPGIGAILGGAAATPETFGMGTLAGGAVGMGAGQGLQDVGNQMLGLEDTSPMTKARNIALSTGVGAIGGAVTAFPKQTAKIAANMAARRLVPRALRPLIGMPTLGEFGSVESKVIPHAAYDIYDEPLFETGTKDLISPNWKAGPEPNLNVSTSDLPSPYKKTGLDRIAELMEEEFGHKPTNLGTSTPSGTPEVEIPPSWSRVKK